MKIVTIINADLVIQNFKVVDAVVAVVMEAVATAAAADTAAAVTAAMGAVETVAMVAADIRVITSNQSAADPPILIFLVCL